MANNNERINKIFTRFFFKTLSFFLLIISYNYVTAHEFWIEPTLYSSPTNHLEAHLRVGQNFEGMTLMFNENDFETFQILSGTKNKKIDVKGIIGDVPAVDMKPKFSDIVIIYHETKDKLVDYKKFQKFQDFVKEKGYAHLIEEHLQAGYPEEYFIESYRRYAKSLIALNGVKGKDKKTGLLFEFVLNENPYDLNSDTISANLFYQKRPMADQLVTIFSRKNRGDLKIDHYETNEKGYIEFAIEEGREYLMDSVIIYPKKGNPEKKEPIWHSIWASTTFLVPERNL
ncbi:DUF4198 domain-containing protein [Alphaproteobacteria bacterium]|nr:DUF4198 domain-containing protein [Alphaproteobacteria bacterium]